MAKHGKHEIVTPRGKKGKFGKGLLIYTLVLLVIVGGVLGWLWARMASFQKKYDGEMKAEARALEEQEALYRKELADKQAAAEKAAKDRAEYRAPQLAFEEWLAQTNSDYWTDLWIILHPNVPETRDRILETLEDRFTGAVPYKAEQFTQDVPVYALYKDDAPLAQITLGGSGTDWTVTDVSFCFEPEQVGTITAPDNASVYCNGVLLDRSYAGDATTYFSCEDLSGEGLAEKLKNPIGWRTYTVSGLLTEPALAYTLPNGLTAAEDTDGTRLIMAEMADYSTYCDNSVAMVKDYMYYFMKGKTNSGTNLFRVLDYYPKNSPLYDSVYSTYYIVSYNITYENIDTSKTEAQNVIIWADNCFSVDVAYDADCTYYGTHVDYATDVMRVFYLNTGSGYKLTAIENRYSE